MVFVSKVQERAVTGLFLPFFLRTTVRLLAMGFVVVQCGGVAAQHLLRDFTSPELPFVARQEKARLLLKVWEFAAPELPHFFDITDEAGLRRLEDAANNLVKDSQARTSTESIDSDAAHYCAYALARAQMIQNLDFSESAVRAFFSVNPGKYPCYPSATVSEITVPKTYTDTVGTTEILAEISQQLEVDNFPKVAYNISNRFGDPNIGYKGTVKRDVVGAERFKLYEKVWNSHSQSGEKLRIGGPYLIGDEYLYVHVSSLMSESGDCFQLYRDRAIQDYGREWLKKIYADTLTTATRELQPEVREFTTGTSTAATAFVVDGHAVTFDEARAMLPFLLGNEKESRFWQSIQRQALEIELIYHSTTGGKIRQMDEYKKLLSALEIISQTRKRIDSKVETETTTENVEQWYAKHRERFVEISHVSYSVFTCGASKVTRQNRYKCAAFLEKLLKSGDETKLPSTIERSDITSAPWGALPRETQTAIQGLGVGEWSDVYSVNGEPQVLRLLAITTKEPQGDLFPAHVKAEFQINRKIRQWERFFEIMFD